MPTKSRGNLNVGNDLILKAVNNVQIRDRLTAPFIADADKNLEEPQPSGVFVGVLEGAIGQGGSLKITTSDLSVTKGWIMNQNGEVELVAALPQENLFLQHPNCQSNSVGAQALRP